MRRNDSGRYLAIVGASLVAVAVLSGTLTFTFHMGALSGRSDAQAQGYAATYPTDTRKQVADCWTKTERSAAQECVASAIQASREAQRSEADLSTQRQMSDWAFWGLVVAIVIGCITTVVTSLGTYLIFKQVKFSREAVEETGRATQAMLEANKLARISHRSSMRPWLFITANPGSLRIVGRELRLHVTITVTNAGKLPARNIQIKAALFIPDGQGDQPQILDKFIMKGVETGLRGTTAMPGQSITASRVAICSISEFSRSIITPMAGKSQVALMIGVDYIGGDENIAHHTYLGYYLTRNNPSPGDWNQLFLVFYPNAAIGELGIQQFEGGLAT